MQKYTSIIIGAIIGALLGFGIVYMFGGKSNLKGGNWTVTGIIIVFALLGAGFFHSLENPPKIGD